MVQSMTESMSSLEKLMNANQSFVQEYFTQLSKFQYDKAKTCVEKTKENTRVWTLFQTALLNFVSGEKNYNNLLFLSQRSGTRIVQDKYYENAAAAFEMLHKETTQRHTNTLVEVPYSFDFQTLNDLSNQLMSLIEFRYQMIAFYFELKDKEMRQEKGSGEIFLKNLNDFKQKYITRSNSHLIEPLKQSFGLEINLLKNLLTCHIALDYKLDCIKAIISIKQINDIFNSQPMFQTSKPSNQNKAFSLFSRSSSQQRQQPILFQWFKIYYQTLLNKFSILMHNSFTKINDVSHIMNEKIPVYNQIFNNLINKFGPFLTGIIFDSTKTQKTNFRGCGYEILDHHQNEVIKSEIDLYPFVFNHPELKTIPYENHMKNIIGLINSEFDSKVKFHYDNQLKTSYYLYSLSDYYTLVVLFDMARQENRTKIATIIQDLGEDLNLNNVFASFNQSLK